MNRIQNITLAWSVETGDSIELWVESTDDCSINIGFESLQYYFLNMHIVYIIKTALPQNLSDSILDFMKKIIEIEELSILWKLTITNKKA